MREGKLMAGGQISLGLEMLPTSSLAVAGRPTGRKCSQSGAGFARTLKSVQRVAQKGEALPRLALCLGERLQMGWRGQGLELRPDGGSRRTGTVVGYFRSIIHAQRVGWSHS